MASKAIPIKTDNIVNAPKKYLPESNIGKDPNTPTTVKKTPAIPIKFLLVLFILPICITLNFINLPYRKYITI